MKLLRAFTKVALEPGETKTVPLSVAVKDLAWYNVETKGWEIEPTTYGVLVGPSSRGNDLLKASFSVAPAELPEQRADAATSSRNRPSASNR